MKRSVRIINGICKVVIIDKKGKIVKIIEDYLKPNIVREREEYVRKIREEEAVQTELIKKIIENEKIHEMHHGKRPKHQRYDKIIKGLDPYKKGLLQNKVELGIIDKAILNIKSGKELLDYWSRNRGFLDYEQYLNTIALGRGFSCYGEYVKSWIYYAGMPSPMKENRLDNRFLGVYIAENGVNKIYEGSKRMQLNNPGFDIICPKGYKIDVKASVLDKYNRFNFSINKNKVADYFILVGFNNIIELEPLYLWVIKSDEKINRGPINERLKLVILNEPRLIDKYKKYEKLDKLEKLKCICKEFDGKNKIEIKDYNAITRYEILNIITRIRSEINEKIFPNDILVILEKKKKENIYDRLIIPAEDAN